METDMTERKPVKGKTEFISLILGAAVGSILKWLVMTYLAIQALTYIGAL